MLSVLRTYGPSRPGPCHRGRGARRPHTGTASDRTRRLASVGGWYHSAAARPLHTTPSGARLDTALDHWTAPTRNTSQSCTLSRQPLSRQPLSSTEFIHSRARRQVRVNIATSCQGRRRAESRATQLGRVLWPVAPHSAYGSCGIIPHGACRLPDPPRRREPAPNTHMVSRMSGR